ncbi:MAG: hypothetical protein KDC98_10240 [Planctomycetes bacterium]|nr:hypothetical protein [Planctomycetota bacterium]
MQRHHPGHPGFTHLLASALLAACSSGGPSAGSGADLTPPSAGVVADGPGSDIDTQTSTSTIEANWSGFVDDSGSIASYSWAIGTSPGGTEVQGWTAVGTAVHASNSTLALAPGSTVFVTVVARDPANNISSPAVSNGVTVTPNGNGNGNGGGGTATSITQWGITWRFAEPMPVGQFCNGDWWVVGPVAIVEISPPTQNVGGRVINGSMLNPEPITYHGYDSTLFGAFANGTYHSSLNVAIGVSPSTPLEITTDASLISIISQMQPAANGSFSQLKTAAVLTVLTAAPPADAFRPAYAGSDKTIRHRERDLDYGRLATVVPVGTPPDMATAAADFERVWLDHTPGWGSRYMHPVENMPDYGRDFTTVYGTGALLAQLDLSQAQKRDLVVRLTQIGIDFWGNVTNGCSWPGEGGHGSGRKFPILFAGAVLDDAAMSAVGSSHPSGYFGPSHPNNNSQFGEDCQTFYVQQTQPGIYNWGFGGYNASHQGLPEWGNSHTTWPVNDSALWIHDNYRRCCTANAWVGQTLAARLMALTAAWNHPSYFDYMDRFMQTETPGEWTRCWDRWQEQMWDHYRSSL